MFQELRCDGAVERADGSMLLTHSSEIRTSVLHTLTRLQPHLPMKRQNYGVYVYVIPLDNGIPLEATTYELVGRVLASKMSRIRGFAKEKADRVLLHTGHVLSAQSEDHANEHYPGAARSRHRVIGIAGLPFAADEVVAIEALVAIRDITRDEAHQMATISNNPYYRMLLHAQ